MKPIILSAILLLATPMPVAANDGYYLDRIAGVLISEGGELGEDYSLMACVVRNRLARGWALSKITNAFSAHYVKPTKAHVDALVAVLNAKAETLSVECRESYFFFADWYAARLNQDVLPVVRLCGNVFYRYQDYKFL